MLQALPKSMYRPLVTGLVLIAISGLAYAHKPFVINGGATDVDTAYEIEDIAISQVGYHKSNPSKPELWCTFEAEAGEILYAQLGLPKIKEFKEERPAMVLLGPGLPAIDVPFDVPDGYGGYLFTSEGETPVLYDEEFTGTFSWQFPEIEQSIPVTGRYYLVGYNPSGENCKFWMALGRAEVFGIEDILTLPNVLFKVRAFHEVGPVGGILFWGYAGFLLIVVGALIGLFKLVAL